MKWRISYQYDNGGTYSPNDGKGGPPFEPMTIEADTPAEAAVKAKEIHRELMIRDGYDPTDSGHPVSAMGMTPENLATIILMGDPDEDNDSDDISTTGFFTRLNVHLVDAKTMEVRSML